MGIDQIMQDVIGWDTLVDDINPNKLGLSWAKLRNKLRLSSIEVVFR